MPNNSNARGIFATSVFLQGESMKNNQIAIIGGGSAGLFASVIAGRLGLKVSVYEKNTKLARKLNITGKGRCNVTNVSDKETFFKNIRRNAKFFYSSYAKFNNRDTMDFFEDLGLALKVERGGRVFPISDKASDVSLALIDEAKKLGVKFYKNMPLLDLTVEESGGYTLKFPQGKRHYPAVIIATGGKSYPLTGSTGDGYQFAKKLELDLEPPRPALVPLVVEEKWLYHLQGLSLKNVRLTLSSKQGKKIGTDFGEMLFTHFGISGPITLSLSGACSDYWLKEEAPVLAELDLKPALSLEQLVARLEREIEKEPKKTLVTLIRHLLPQSMVEVFLKFVGLEGKKVNITLSKKDKAKLAWGLKHFSFTVKETRPFKEAIITSGGVSIKALDPKTMMVKSKPGLFFIGEVIDMDAYTGGYNLQLAFSTAYSAAHGAYTYLKEKN